MLVKPSSSKKLKTTERTNRYRYIECNNSLQSCFAAIDDLSEIDCMVWFWLSLLGLFTYFVMRQSVGRVTRTPVWLLWLVIMTPALIWSGWVLVQGQDQPIPALLVIGPFVLCPLLYWFLVQRGRLPTQESAERSTATPEASAQSKAPEKKQDLRPITKEEESRLRNCFSWSVYYLQAIEYRPQAIVCRGQLRGKPEVTYQTIQENIEAQFGDRFLVVFQEGSDNKPFFVLVPNPQAHHSAKQQEQRFSRPGLALGLLALTLLTTTGAGIQFAGLSPEDLDADWTLLQAGLPYSLTLLAILGTHELGHYLAARFYQIRTTLPYFIPFPYFLGTFGAFIRIRSPIPNRKALFDVGLAGPLAGFVVTLPVLVWGLAHSRIVPLSPEAGIFNFEALDPSASLFLALLSKAVLGNAWTASTAIHLHPAAIAGCIGLIVTALNLMPVGQLDGGHIVHAMLGQRTGAFIGQIARLLVLLLSLVQNAYLIWALLLFFIPAVDEPTLNDVSQLDDRRDLWGLIALGILVLIVLPAPRPVIELLHG